MLGNSHPGLRNVRLNPEALRVDDGTDTYDGAGEGEGGRTVRTTMTTTGRSISLNHNLTHVTTRSVPAGSELFHNYGERWFLRRGDRLGIDAARPPNRANYDGADEIVSAFAKFVVEHGLIAVATATATTAEEGEGEDRGDGVGDGVENGGSRSSNGSKESDGGSRLAEAIRETILRGKGEGPAPDENALGERGATAKTWTSEGRDDDGADDDNGNDGDRCHRRRRRGGGVPS